MNTPQTWADSPIHEQIRTMNDTPTLETDAKQKLKDIIGDEYVSAYFARRLERQRDEAREALKTGGMLNIIDRAAHERAAAIRERDEARETLAELRASVLDLSHPNIKMILSERDEAREEVGQLKSRLTQTMGAVTISRNGYVQELEQQRDRLAEALLELRNSESFSLCGAAYEIIEQALQSLTSKP